MSGAQRRDRRLRSGNPTSNPSSPAAFELISQQSASALSSLTLPATQLSPTIPSSSHPTLPLPIPSSSAPRRSRFRQIPPSSRTTRSRSTLAAASAAASATASAAALDPASPADNPSQSLTQIVPARSLLTADVWSTLSIDNVATSVLTADAAHALKPREELALRLTPASHLVQMAHGSTDLAVARAASLILWSSVKAKTRVKYAGHIIAFLCWCDELGVPLHFRFPTASNILLLYLRKDMTSLRASTIEHRTHALAWWHKIQRMPWSLERKEQKAFQKAVKIESLPPLEKRRPVRLNDIVVISQSPKPNDRAHVAIVAAALFAFYAMCRPGEFTVRNGTSPHEDRPRWTHLIEQAPVSPGGPASMILALPSEKARGNAGFDRIVSEQRHLPNLCPVKAVQRHRALNAPRADESANALGAFSYVGENGNRYELTEGLFSRTINTWLSAAGREPVTGHCFRIGGATFFFAANKPMEDIRTRGGWQSDAYLTYIRDNYVRHAASFGDLAPDGLFYG